MTIRTMNVEEILGRLETVERELAGVKRSRRRWGRLAALAALLAALVATAAVAAPGSPMSCPGGEIYCFDRDTPARASEVNHNFAQVLAWVEEKVGTVGTSAVTVTGTLTAQSNVGVGGPLTLDGALTMNGDPATVNGALDIRGPVRMYESYRTRAIGTNHTAGTDGLVVAFRYYSSNGSHLRLIGYVGGTVRTRSAVRNDSGDTGTNIVFPVRRGDTYRVDSSGEGTATMYFIPLGRSQSS
jgi:hypothetical protein